MVSVDCNMLSIDVWSEKVCEKYNQCWMYKDFSVSTLHEALSQWNLVLTNTNKQVDAYTKTTDGLPSLHERLFCP